MKRSCESWAHLKKGAAGALNFLLCFVLLCEKKRCEKISFFFHILCGSQNFLHFHNKWSNTKPICTVANNLLPKVTRLRIGKLTKSSSGRPIPIGRVRRVCTLSSQRWASAPCHLCKTFWEAPIAATSTRCSCITYHSWTPSYKQRCVPTCNDWLTRPQAGMWTRRSTWKQESSCSELLPSTFRCGCWMFWLGGGMRRIDELEPYRFFQKLIIKNHPPSRIQLQMISFCLLLSFCKFQASNCRFLFLIQSVCSRDCCCATVHQLFGSRQQLHSHASANVRFSQRLFFLFVALLPTLTRVFRFALAL